MRYAPGQPVTVPRFGTGRVGGVCSHFGAVRYRVMLDQGGSIDVPEGNIRSAGEVPVYGVGQRVRVRFPGTGTVIERLEREDAPGHLYVVELPKRTRSGQQKTTTVGAEQFIVN